MSKLLLLVAIISTAAAVLAPVSSSAAADTTRPGTAIATPAADQQYRAGDTVAISGTAIDNSYVARVDLTIYDRANFATWNGSAFTSSRATVNATLNWVGSRTNRTWTYSFTPPPGRYIVLAKAFDSAGNNDTNPVWRAFTVTGTPTISPPPNPSPPSPAPPNPSPPSPPQPNPPQPDRLNPVTDLRVSSATATSVTVSWRADDDSRRRSFDLFVNGRWITFTGNARATSHTFNGLSPSTAYALGVTAVGDRNGNWPGPHYSQRTTIQARTLGRSSETVVWEDNFNYFNTNHWRVEHSTYGDGNNELQCYTPNNVSVRSGKLVLRAKHETATCPGGSTRQVTSGMVRSKNVTFSPGQAIEFRVKLTPADSNDQGGLWPAVWASSWAPGGWPRGGELDWLEVMTAINPKRSIFTAHYMNTAGDHAKNGRPVFGSENFSDSWHVVRFNYGEDGKLTWYLDGEQVHTITNLPTIQSYPTPFDSTIREIKVNLALGGSPGPLAPAALGSQGATFEMDYIRIINM